MKQPFTVDRGGVGMAIEHIRHALQGQRTNDSEIERTVLTSEEAMKESPSSSASHRRDGSLDG